MTKQRPHVPAPAEWPRATVSLNMDPATIRDRFHELTDARDAGNPDRIPDLDRKIIRAGLLLELATGAELRAAEGRPMVVQGGRA